MSDAFLSSVVRALDLAVVERLPNSAFHLVTPAPGWLADVFETAPTGAQRTLGGALPFLDDFLVQADVAWRDGHTASSGPFAATVGGTEHLLRATALTVEQRKLMVLERLSGEADTRPILQKAREQMLEHEELVRQIVAVHEPASRIDLGLKQLTETSLTPAQHDVLERVSRASAELQAALAPLPSLPPRLRRQARTV